MVAVFKAPASCSTFVLLMILTAAGELRAQDSVTADRGRKVEMPAYTVSEPADGGWKVEKDMGHQAIRFTRTRKFLMSKVQATMLVVVRDSSPAEHWALPPHELADSLRHNEVATMTADAVQNRYELKDVKSGVDTVAGMPLYSLRYQKVLSLPERWHEDGILLLFFPEDFADRHVLYSFFMSDFYKSPAGGHMGVKRKPELINALVSSFRVR